MLSTSTIPFLGFTPGNERDLGKPEQCTAILSTSIEPNDVVKDGDGGDGKCPKFCFLWRPLLFSCSCRNGCDVSGRSLKLSSKLVTFSKALEATVEGGKKLVGPL